MFDKLTNRVFKLCFLFVVLLVPINRCSSLSSLFHSNPKKGSKSYTSGYTKSKLEIKSTPIPCGGNNKILNDPRVQAAMRKFWKMGYDKSSINDRHEITALINKRKGGGYEVDIIPPIYADANSWHGHISVLIKTVAILHLHPMYNGLALTYQNDPKWFNHYHKPHDIKHIYLSFGVSPEDSTIVANYSLPMYVMDGNAIRKIIPLDPGKYVKSYPRGNCY